jgi:hypothetical protein
VAPTELYAQRVENAASPPDIFRLRFCIVFTEADPPFRQIQFSFSFVLGESNNDDRTDRQSQG